MHTFLAQSTGWKADRSDLRTSCMYFFLGKVGDSKFTGRNSFLSATGLACADFGVQTGGIGSSSNFFLSLFSSFSSGFSSGGG